MRPPLQILLRLGLSSLIPIVSATTNHWNMQTTAADDDEAMNIQLRIYNIPNIQICLFVVWLSSATIVSLTISVLTSANPWQSTPWQSWRADLYVTASHSLKILMVSLLYPQRLKPPLPSGNPKLVSSILYPIIFPAKTSDLKTNLGKSQTWKVFPVKTNP